jgi:hypothetical protein
MIFRSFAMAKPYVCCRTVSADYLGNDEHPVNQQAQESRMLTSKEIECLRATQFRRHFPVLAAMLRFHELSTPLTQQHYVRAQDGATYRPSHLPCRAGVRRISRHPGVLIAVPAARSMTGPAP